MPTRFYFHSASNTLSGTFPSGEQSSRTANYTATGANTLRTMDDRVGISQASLSATTLNNTNLQNGFMGFFCSQPLKGAQTVGGGTWRLNVADSESNLNANAWVNSINVYVWRPSNGTLVGTVRDAAALGALEPTSANSQQVSTFTFTTSAVSALNGDVVICEIWEQITQGMATAYTVTFFYDGTTESLVENTVTTSQASFIESSEILWTMQLPNSSVGHPFMF